MTYDKWVGATQCKIPGMWNLHSLLPEDMDFFILLSSVVSVIDNTGQANCAAGNSYLDAVAHLPRNRDMSATSLNISLVSDTTHFTEDFLALYGHLILVQVTGKEFNITTEAAIEALPHDGWVPPRVILGIRRDLEREGAVMGLWPKDGKFDRRVQEKGGAGADADKYRLMTIMTNAILIKEAAEVVEFALNSNVANSMVSSPDDIDGDKPLHAFGSKLSPSLLLHPLLHSPQEYSTSKSLLSLQLTIILAVDSPKAVQVRNWVLRETKADVSVFEILGPTPLSVLSVKIAAKSMFTKPKVSKQAADEAAQE